MRYKALSNHGQSALHMDSLVLSDITKLLHTAMPVHAQFTLQSVAALGWAHVLMVLPAKVLDMC